MQLPSPITGGSLRRLLAVFAVIGQLIGTIGIIPVRADSSEDSSTPFPCQNHPCGCRTAARCWAGACCCYTMRQKVAWAAERGVTPPDHAVRMAAEEEKQRDQERSNSAAKCCVVKQDQEKGLAEQPDQQSSSTETGIENPLPNPFHGVGWVASIFAQKCQGQEIDGIGLLNVGVPPSPPIILIFQLIFIDTQDSPNQIAIAMAFSPLLPPPKF